MPQFVVRTVVLLGCSLFQMFLTTVCGVLFFMISLMSGQIIWVTSNNPDLANTLGPYIGGTMMVAFYGTAWYVFWRLQVSDGQIQWFGNKVLFSTVPLLVCLFFYQPPHEDPVSMVIVDVPPAFTFVCLFIAFVGLPIYSFAMRNYLFSGSNRQPWRFWGTILLCAPLLTWGGWQFYDALYG